MLVARMVQFCIVLIFGFGTDGQSCGPPVSLFGMRCLAQKPAGSWMKLCLGVRMGTQVREGYGGFVANVFLFSQAWS